MAAPTTKKRNANRRCPVTPSDTRPPSGIAVSARRATNVSAGRAACPGVEGDRDEQRRGEESSPPHSTSSSPRSIRSGFTRTTPPGALPPAPIPSIRSHKQPTPRARTRSTIAAERAPASTTMTEESRSKCGSSCARAAAWLLGERERILDAREELERLLQKAEVAPEREVVDPLSRHEQIDNRLAAREVRDHAPARRDRGLGAPLVAPVDIDDDGDATEELLLVLADDGLASARPAPSVEVAYRISGAVRAHAEEAPSTLPSST